MVRVRMGSRCTSCAPSSGVKGGAGAGGVDGMSLSELGAVQSASGEGSTRTSGGEAGCAAASARSRSSTSRSLPAGTLAGPSLPVSQGACASRVSNASNRDDSTPPTSWPSAARVRALSLAGEVDRSAGMGVPGRYFELDAGRKKPVGGA